MSSSPLPEQPTDWLHYKRHGQSLNAEQWQNLVATIVDETMSDAQLAALAMAVCCHPLTDDEQQILTNEMARQGECFDWQTMGFDEPIVDKHSTGGIGDKVSLILAPLLAACGAVVPMISGRGLGHTGGTLDKLDAIPGYQTQVSGARFATALQTAGCAIVGQTRKMVPADRRLYAVRSLTATVDNQGLIVASILSKKMAAGVQTLTLDVKTGSGAFMTTLTAAQELAAALVRVARLSGLRCSALISDMNQVLGHCAGNALEIAEAIHFMTGQRQDTRLKTITFELAANLLTQCGLYTDKQNARNKLETVLQNGETAERFAQMVAALGGPGDLVTRPDHYLEKAPVMRAVYPATSAVVDAINVRAIGETILSLGGGQRQPNQSIDYRVGLSEAAGLGEPVDKERPIAIIHARNERDADFAQTALLSAYQLAAAPGTRTHSKIILAEIVQPDGSA